MEAQLQSLDYFSSWGLARFVGLHMSLRAAVELNVFNIIAQSGPNSQLSSAEIVSKIPTTNPNAATALERILRVLAANAFLSSALIPRKTDKIRREMIYGLTKETRGLVTKVDGVSSATMLLLSSEREIVDAYYKLKDAVLEPGCVPFQKAHGVSVFEFASQKPEFNKLFNDSMVVSSVFFDKVLEVYGGFGEVKEVMDVGGGIGISLSKIVSIYPHIRGINFDLPHVIADAPKYKDVEHVAGDMFESLPNAQAILLKWILHDWDDEHCINLLKNCWKALPNNGKVLVVEFTIPEVLENKTNSLDAIQLDLSMMALFGGGKERTIAEFEDLANAAGFAETKLFPIAHGIYVIEFFKTASN